MHKLLDYICDELETLERKAERDSSLTMSEIQYADTLLRMKKNILKTEDYSDSYSRGRRRDSEGRYMSDRYMVDRVKDMMREAPDDATRMEFQRFVDKLERR